MNVQILPFSCLLHFYCIRSDWFHFIAERRSNRSGYPSNVCWRTALHSFGTIHTSISLFTPSCSWKKILPVRVLTISHLDSQKHFCSENTSLCFEAARDRMAGNMEFVHHSCSSQCPRHSSCHFVYHLQTSWHLHASTRWGPLLSVAVLKKTSLVLARGNGHSSQPINIHCWHNSY